MSDRPQTRECSIDQLQPERLKLAKQYISNTDRILICFETKREWSSGFLGFGIKCRLFAAICTQRRVIRVMHNYRDDDYVDEASTMELVDIESIQESQMNTVAAFNCLVVVVPNWDFTLILVRHLRNSLIFSE